MRTSNTRTEVTKAPDASLGPDLLYFLRYWLRDRRVLIAIALAVVIGGAVLNWSWLVAAGLAPLVFMLPCVAMFAMGMCKMGKGKGDAACGKNARSGEASGRDDALPAGPALERKRAAGSE